MRTREYMIRDITSKKNGGHEDEVMTHVPMMNTGRIFQNHRIHTEITTATIRIDEGDLAL
jgi:hypothetical protein